jgi:outer membrane protein TolC
MPPSRLFQWTIPGLLLLALASGCARFDPVRARRDHTEAFTSNLAARVEAELTRPLSLDDCVRIALSNNYAVRKADLDRELYRIGKNVAFTAFLPNVAASAGYNVYEKEMPQQHERRFGTADLTAGMPVFMPSTWFLYAAARHGYAAAGVAARYVRQTIVLQTSVRYYNVLVQLDTITALETQLEAARQTADRVGGLADEGLAARWEGDQARMAADLRESELNQARRQLAVLRGELLHDLGLPPDAPLELSGDTGKPRLPQGDLEDLVLQALEVHPELALADRQVVIQDHQVRQAFCDFLPTISLFSTGSWTGNDLAAPAENWVSGFQGAWTLFDGLANVARYRAAKVERQQTRLERENTSSPSWSASSPPRPPSATPPKPPASAGAPTMSPPPSGPTTTPRPARAFCPSPTPSTPAPPWISPRSPWSAAATRNASPSPTSNWPWA